MLPSQNRLRAHDVASLGKKGAFLRNKYFTARYIPAARIGVAVVVSKKVYKKAVDRNALRRKVYTACIPLLPSLPALHIVIYPHIPVSTLTGIEVTQSLKELLVSGKVA